MTSANMSAERSLEIETELGAHNYKPLDVVLTRGEGVWVWDVDGNRYLDCLSAYSAVNQGHCHPKIGAALVDQVSRLTLTSRAFRNDQLAAFYEEICALTNSHKVLPMNSGAEAVETAIKTVRKWGYEVKGVAPGRAEIIVCENNFHGRTLAIVGFSTDATARAGFGPRREHGKQIDLAERAGGDQAVAGRDRQQQRCEGKDLAIVPVVRPGAGYRQHEGRDQDAAYRTALCRRPGAHLGSRR